MWPLVEPRNLEHAFFFLCWRTAPKSEASLYCIARYFSYSHVDNPALKPLSTSQEKSSSVRIILVDLGGPLIL